MKVTFKQAIEGIQQGRPKEISDRLVAIGKEQEALFKELQELLPLEDDYTWATSAADIVRPFYCPKSSSSLLED